MVWVGLKFASDLKLKKEKKSCRTTKKMVNVIGYFLSYDFIGSIYYTLQHKNNR